MSLKVGDMFKIKDVAWMRRYFMHLHGFVMTVIDVHEEYDPYFTGNLVIKNTIITFMYSDNRIDSYFKESPFEGDCVEKIEL